MMAASQGHTAPILMNDTTIGVLLAANSVGQHSMGIDWLLRRFGAASADGHGLRTFDEHVATTVPDWARDNLTHEEKLYLDVGPKPKKIRSTSTVLCVEGHLEHATTESRRYSPLSVVTGAWDDSSFAVRGYDEEGRRVVDLLHEGLVGLDLVIWCSTGIEIGSGLCIARRSLVPDTFVEAFDADVEAARRLHAAADATGIAERLSGMGQIMPFGRMRPYYALSPSWIDPEMAKRSAHPVKFFLNPAQQDHNNFGWFTVEELDEWIEGHGPIPKQPRKGKSS